MAVKRSVEGLRRNAQKKRQETFERVEKGIQQLVKEKRVINFNTVAESSGVSKAWLYKEADIRDRIEQLRAQSSGSKKKPPIKQRASDASKDALLKIMRERIKRLEAENKDLRRQNEVAYSHVLKARDLEKEVQRLNAHIERLQQQTQAQSVVVNPAEQKDIQRTLADLGVEPNSTLERLIGETPVGIVENAIESLREALTNGPVRNPDGFLNKAINDAWKPNDKPETQLSKDMFKQWYDLAHSQRLVIGAQHLEGIQYVITPDGQHVLFNDMLRQKPIAELSKQTM